jgi:hypothetical protein
VGVVDRYLLDKALAEADPAHLREYLAALKPSHWAFPETRVLLDAYQGIGRPALEKKLTRHAQAAMRIYGVLPVKDSDDVRQRYLTLKKLHKEVRKYGAERQANSHAALQAGLENLSRVAGSLLILLSIHGSNEDKGCALSGTVAMYFQAATHFLRGQRRILDLNALDGAGFKHLPPERKKDPKVLISIACRIQ